MRRAPLADAEEFGRDRALSRSVPTRQAVRVLLLIQRMSLRRRRRNRGLGSPVRFLLLALLVASAARHFGRDEGHSGHASDIVKRSKMTQMDACYMKFAAAQFSVPRLSLVAIFRFDRRKSDSQN
jgi:hypothetical protein